MLTKSWTEEVTQHHKSTHLTDPEGIRLQVYKMHAQAALDLASAMWQSIHAPECGNATGRRICRDPHALSSMNVRE